MNVSLWVTVSVGAAALLGAAGRGLRNLYKLLRFGADMIEVVHARSAELAPNHGASMRDRIEAMDAWKSGVDSSITGLTTRVDQLERTVGSAPALPGRETSV